MWDAAGTGTQTQQPTCVGSACVAVERLEASLGEECYDCSAANKPTVRCFLWFLSVIAEAVSE